MDATRTEKSEENEGVGLCPLSENMTLFDSMDICFLESSAKSFICLSLSIQKSILFLQGLF